MITVIIGVLKLNQFPEALHWVVSMSSSKNSRVSVFWFVVGLTLVLWGLRGIGLLTFIPGFVLGLLIAASIALLIINGWIETR